MDWSRRRVAHPQSWQKMRSLTGAIRQPPCSIMRAVLIGSSCRPFTDFRRARRPKLIDELDPLKRGALIHEIQFAFFERLSADKLLPVGPAS